MLHTIRLLHLLVLSMLNCALHFLRPISIVHCYDLWWLEAWYSSRIFVISWTQELDLQPVLEALDAHMRANPLHMDALIHYFG